jgi:hypothetical protein
MGFVRCMVEHHMLETAVRGVRKTLNGKIHYLLYSFSYKYVVMVIGTSSVQYTYISKLISTLLH